MNNAHTEVLENTQKKLEENFQKDPLEKYKKKLLEQYQDDSQHLFFFLVLEYLVLKPPCRKIRTNFLQNLKRNSKENSIF